MSVILALVCLSSSLDPHDLNVRPVEPSSLTDQRMVTDVVCGPRAVQKVLREYGMDEELHVLIREIQSPVLQRGSSLAELKRCLEDRGIYTRAVRVQTGEYLDWKHPVLVHVPDNGNLGHFCVWLPPNNGAPAHVWSGLARPAKDSAWEAGDTIVLLTSPTPINSSMPHVRSFSIVGALTVGCGVGCIMLALARLFDRMLTRTSRMLARARG